MSDGVGRGSADEVSEILSDLLAEPVDTGRPETAALLRAVTDGVAERLAERMGRAWPGGDDEGRGGPR